MARESIRVEGLANVLNVLRSLPAEATKQGGNIVRTSVRKAAQLMRDEAKSQLSDNVESGLLRDNIIASRGKMQGTKGERFLVRVRPKKYPEDKGAKTTTTKVARILEYGTEDRPADPWLRPAFESKKYEAVQVMTTEVTTRLDNLVKKLDRRR